MEASPNLYPNTRADYIAMHVAARVAAFYVENDVAILAFADRDPDPVFGLILSVAHSFYHQDRRLGLDGIHIEFELAKLSGYSLVDDISMDGRTVSLRLRNSIDPHVEIELASNLDAGHIAGGVAYMATRLHQRA
jgi:hypothetical protein